MRDLWVSVFHFLRCDLTVLQDIHAAVRNQDVLCKAVHIIGRNILNQLAAKVVDIHFTDFILPVIAAHVDIFAVGHVRKGAVFQHDFLFCFHVVYLENTAALDADDIIAGNGIGAVDFFSRLIYKAVKNMLDLS